MNPILWLVAAAGWSYCWLSACLTALYAPNGNPRDTQ